MRLCSNRKRHRLGGISSLLSYRDIRKPALISSTPSMGGRLPSSRQVSTRARRSNSLYRNLTAKGSIGFPHSALQVPKNGSKPKRPFLSDDRGEQPAAAAPTF